MPQLDIDVMARPKRLVALRRARTLLAATPAPVSGLIRLAARTVGAPFGLLALVGEKETYVVGSHGVPPSLEEAVRQATTCNYCQEVVRRDAPVVIREAHGSTVAGVPGIGAYIGQPIHDPSGQTLGAMCIADVVPRRWTDDDVAAIADCANLLETMLGAAADRGAVGATAAELDTVLETAIEAFIAIELTGEVTRWNRAATRTFGWSAEEALGRKVELLIVPERFRAAHRAGLARLNRGGMPKLFGQRLQLWALHRDGREFPVELTLNVVDGAHGRVAHAFLYDISERVTAERALARERHFLQALLDNLHAGVVACDERGQLILFNRAMREITGTSAPDGSDGSGGSGGPVKQPWTDWYTEAERDVLPLIRAFHGESVRDAELTLDLPGHGQRIFLANAEPIRDNDGARLGAVAALHDVTERRRAQRFVECELAVSRILEHAKTIDEVGAGVVQSVATTLGWSHGELWLVDRVGNVLRMAAHWTDPRHELADFAPGPLAPGTGLSGDAWQQGQPVWVPDISLDHDRFNRQALAEQGLRVGLAVPIRDGSNVTGTLTFFGQVAEEPDTALIALLSGIAAHVGQYLERRRAEELALQLARAKDEFIALVGHELRTPLTSISAYTDLLLADDENPEDREQFLGVIARNAETLRAIIDDLLDLAGLESGYVTMNERRLNFADIVREAAEHGRPSTAEKDLDFVLDVPAEEVPVSGDPPRLRQVVDHLLTNAVKYTPIGGRVEIKLVQDVAGLTLCVSDTGVGIPAEERERLFQRFFRASNIRNHGVPGTGLGLAISRTVIERHGGTITSTDHGDSPGTTFLVRLPTVA